MIPIRDDAAKHRLTLINTFLILANVAVFTVEVRLGSRAGTFLAHLAMVPAKIVHAGLRVGQVGANAGGLWTPATLLTSLFLHAGLLHIAGNMLYLYIFGPAVEERLGHLRFMWFYMLSGVAAGLAMVAMAPESRVPVIGASGAIAGVLGAYFILYPRGRILTILPIFFFIEFIEIPAVAYLMLWFAVQLYAGVRSGAQGPLAGGVAWWAHVGGFLFGIGLGPLLARHKSPARRRGC
jgi:membrane associated rhomboid family serine protease